MRLLLYLALAGGAFASRPVPPRVVTVGGTGIAGYGGDQGIATDAQFNNPYGLTVGPDGALYICDVDNHVIRRLDLRTRQLSTVAGNARPGYSGDGGLATDASLNQPYEVKFDSAGNMFFVEVMNHVVRRVDFRSHRIFTVAGMGTAGFSGDGGPAVRAHLRAPHSIAFDALGRLLICDTGNARIRRVDLRTNVIETMAGNGDRRATPDGAPVEGTALNGPRAIETDRQGNLYIVLREGNQVLRLDSKTNHYSIIAGTGQRGYSGDGGPALKALLSGPKGLAYFDGLLFLADTENHSIRKIDLRTGVITTVMGNGERGDGPDGEPTKCHLARPHGVAVDIRGTLFVADSENHRVRELREPPPAIPPMILSPQRKPVPQGVPPGSMVPRFRKSGASATRNIPKIA